MDVLLENPILFWAIGAVLVTFCGLIFLSKRTLPALFALIGVLLFTILLLAAEWYVVTEREAVGQALTELLLAIEENETLAALEFVDPSATKLRAEVELLMPMIAVSDSGATSVRVEVDDAAQPLQATCRFRGKLKGVHSLSGTQVFYFDDVETTWVKRGDNWLLDGMVVYYKGKQINAVESARSNRPASAGS